MVNDRASGSDFLSALVAGAREAAPAVGAPAAIWQAIDELAAANNWPATEAALIVFAYGLAVRQAEQAIDLVASGRATAAEQQAILEEQFLSAESSYAALKFRTYHLGEDRRILGHQAVGFSKDIEAMQHHVQSVEQAIRDLETEVERLQARAVAEGESETSDRRGHDLSAPRVPNREDHDDQS